MQTIPRTIKILLVENNISDALILQKFFAKITTYKCQVMKIESLSDGLKHLEQNNFDIILLNLLPKDSWGIESLKKIQQIALGIPIVVMTERENKEVGLAALREGAQDYIVKEEICERLLTRSINQAIERKHSIEALSQSEARYRGVVEDQTELICRFLPNGSLTFVNPAYCRYFKKSPLELLGCNFVNGDNFTKFIVPEDLELVAADLKSLSWHNPTSNLEFRVITHEEKVRWQQWNHRAIFQGKKIVEYQAVGRDISDRKQAERDKARLIASLHESEERFRIVTNSAAVLIWMSDANGQGIFFNQSWLDFTGRSLEAELIDNWLANIHDQDRQRSQNLYQSALKERKSVEIEYRLLRHDGQYRWIFNTIVPRFKSNGKFDGFVGSCIDITKRKLAEEKLARQAECDHILAEITQHIYKSLKLEAILQAALIEISRFLHAEKIFIAKVNNGVKSQMLLEYVYPNLAECCEQSRVFEDEVMKFPAKLNQLRAGDTLFLDQEAKKQICCNKHQSLSRKNSSTIIVPIISEQQLWGLLCIRQYSQKRIWQNEEINLLEQISLQLAIAIKQSELYHQLEKANQELETLAVIDSLTGIANRRKFDEYLASEWLRLSREQAPLSLILCDIDHFKLYNDTYGHQRGDLCLRQVAQAIQQTVKRPADLTARYGGEELAIVLPHTNHEGAASLAQKICLHIQALQIPHIASPVALYITLSLGVAGCIPNHDTYPQDLIAIADQNLYQAKKMGKNRVVTELEVISKERTPKD